MKRSAQVALVLMSAATVGGAGYAMMPRQNCTPPGNAVPNATSPTGVAPKGVAPTGADQSCNSRSLWRFHRGRPIFGAWHSSIPNGRSNLSSSNTNSTSSTMTSRTSSGGTTRGGFGGTSTALASRGG